MRKMFLLILLGTTVFFGFAQSVDDAETQPPAVVTEEEEKEPADEPAPKPSVFSVVIQYFQWGKKTAVRKDFILSTLSFLWISDKQGISEALFTMHWSFLPFTSVGAGLEISGLFGEQPGYPQFAGLATQAGFVLPVTANIKIFGDLVLEIGYGTASIIPNTRFALNIGYDVGFTIMRQRDFGIEITYKGLWTKDGRYQNALGFGWLWNFWL